MSFMTKIVYHVQLKFIENYKFCISKNKLLRFGINDKKCSGFVWNTKISPFKIRSISKQIRLVCQDS